MAFQIKHVFLTCLWISYNSSVLLVFVLGPKVKGHLLMNAVQKGKSNIKSLVQDSTYIISANILCPKPVRWPSSKLRSWVCPQPLWEWLRFIKHRIWWGDDRYCQLTSLSQHNDDDANIWICFGKLLCFSKLTIKRQQDYSIKAFVDWMEKSSMIHESSDGTFYLVLSDTELNSVLSV